MKEAACEITETLNNKMRYFSEQDGASMFTESVLRRLELGGKMVYIVTSPISRQFVHILRGG